MKEHSFQDSRLEYPRSSLRFIPARNAGRRAPRASRALCLCGAQRADTPVCPTGRVRVVVLVRGPAPRALATWRPRGSCVLCVTPDTWTCPLPGAGPSPHALLTRRSTCTIAIAGEFPRGPPMRARGARRADPTATRARGDGRRGGAPRARRRARTEHCARLFSECELFGSTPVNITLSGSSHHR